MAAQARLHAHFKFEFIFCLFLGTFFVSSVLASPLPPSSRFHVYPLPPSDAHVHLLAPRGKFAINNATGTPQVFSPASQAFIPQGPATDGGGTDFDVAAIIWLVFCFVIGTPMSFAGIRGWRVTTGVGIGLSAVVCSWAAIINTVNNVGISDAVLSAISIGFFFLGFILGVFEIGRAAGIATLGVTGGLAFGIRIFIVREGLLIPGLAAFSLNWMLIAVLGALGGAAMVWGRTQRGGIVFASASVGTFLVFLGIDLIINRQSGMSRGLRYLFDRNNSHVLDIIVGGYKPPLSTQILLIVSLVLTYVQRLEDKSFLCRAEKVQKLPVDGSQDIKSTATMIQQLSLAKGSTGRVGVTPKLHEAACGGAIRRPAILVQPLHRIAAQTILVHTHVEYTSRNPSQWRMEYGFERLRRSRRILEFRMRDKRARQVSWKSQGIQLQGNG
ncbi:hypothetical protein DXG03_004028 [Asterophora parasitica]|uniref:TM7S3/TM198-like domain-containing protein n=1 Tax=Asterophora parasitica TaxID=117018 RepID=A0A9P7G8W1_9AGAR|nr:hypothetical protein DXG03_004028 [Asterophora parasitica]